MKAIRNDGSEYPIMDIKDKMHLLFEFFFRTALKDNGNTIMIEMNREYSVSDIVIGSLEKIRSLISLPFALFPHFREMKDLRNMQYRCRKDSSPLPL